MDDETQRLLARFEHRMANANRYYLKAEAARAAADEIERKLALPIHERPLEDETILKLEARLKREEAEEHTRYADGIQARLHKAPSQELTEEVEAWAKRQRDGLER